MVLVGIGLGGGASRRRARDCPRARGRRRARSRARGRGGARDRGALRARDGARGRVDLVWFYVLRIIRCSYSCLSCVYICYCC